MVFRVFFAILYVCKWKFRYGCDKKYKIKTYNLDRNFAKLRADQTDDGHSSDDEEIYQAAKRIYLEREHEIMNQKGIKDQSYSEMEVLEIAMEQEHDRNMSKRDNEDADYYRNDLEDADDEELEDRLIEAARVARRPLNMDEVIRESRGKFDGANMSNSIISGVLSQNDVQLLQRSTVRADSFISRYSFSNGPQSSYRSKQL